MSNKLVLKNNGLVLYKTSNECFYSCNNKDVFIASLNGTINLSLHENILTIALINIHYLYTESLLGNPISLFLANKRGFSVQCSCGQ